MGTRESSKTIEADDLAYYNPHPEKEVKMLYEMEAGDICSNFFLPDMPFRILYKDENPDRHLQRMRVEWISGAEQTIFSDILIYAWGQTIEEWEAEKVLWALSTMKK
jgi:hypothetical protein